LDFWFENKASGNPVVVGSVLPLNNRGQDAVKVHVFKVKLMYKKV
jgi:hypothetical protein